MRFRFGELVVFAVFLFAAAVAVIVVVPQEQATAQQGFTSTRWGPLSPADRDFLVKVRWAGLWEIPAGRWAQERSQNEKVKIAGQHLEADHAKLDEAVRAEAAALGVLMPNEPNPDQQRWLGEMSNATGAEFDQIFADRLRAAHGKVFATVAAIRAGTRNDRIRAFATVANEVVMKHMRVLEETGLVDYSALPVPPV